MHYKTLAAKWEMAPVKKDLKEMGIEQIEARPKLSLTKKLAGKYTGIFAQLLRLIVYLAPIIVFGSTRLI